MGDRTPANLSANVRRLREERGFTQQRLAEVSGVPRPTVANLETGAANPTLGVLVKMAAALGVSIGELVVSPSSAIRVHKAGALPAKVRGQGLVRRLLPDPIPGMHIARLEIAAGGKMTGIPRTEGTREYIACESGELEINAAGEVVQLSAGDVAVLTSNDKQSLVNRGRRPVVAYSVSAFAPAGA